MSLSRIMLRKFFNNLSRRNHDLSLFDQIHPNPDFPLNYSITQYAKCPNTADILIPGHWSDKTSIFLFVKPLNIIV